jgi:hypothetical protein
VNFNEAICDFGARVNIIPKPTDQSLCYTKGILEDICVWVGNSYVTADFVVIEIGGDVKSPIILG